MSVADMTFNLCRALKQLKILPKKRRQTSRSLTGNKGGKEQRCLLLELPTELLLEIASHLTDVSEACLALTCKGLFAISRPILNAESLRFNRDFARLFHHYQDYESFGGARWQLLTLLEDRKWRACAKCLKLHPRKEFSSRELKRAPEGRTCNLGNLAGIVDLCPCIKLTFRDKLDLIRLLQKRRDLTRALAASTINNGVSEKPFSWHSCTEKYGSTELKIEIFLELDGKDRLLVRTEYELIMNPGQLGTVQHMTARLGCAHRSIDLWFSSVCQTTICRLHDSVCEPCKNIKVCSGCNATLSCPPGARCYSPSRDRVRYSFWTQRCLGGPTSVPDKTWAAQRIHPAGPSVGLHISNELCPWALRQHPFFTWPPLLGMHILVPGMSDEPLSQLYYSIHRI